MLFDLNVQLSYTARRGIPAYLPILPTLLCYFCTIGALYIATCRHLYYSSASFCPCIAFSDATCVMIFAILGLGSLSALSLVFSFGLFLLHFSNSCTILDYRMGKSALGLGIDISTSRSEHWRLWDGKYGVGLVHLDLDLAVMTFILEVSKAPQRAMYLYGMGNNCKRDDALLYVL